MILLFSIFSKGGLVLWCFGEGQNFLKDAINRVLRNVVQETSFNSTNVDGYTIKFKTDNEFEIILMVVYQSILRLEYSDKLIDETHLRFRDIYKNKINVNEFLVKGSRIFDSFDKEFSSILHNCISGFDGSVVKQKKFHESEKSKKTLASLIEGPKNHEELNHGSTKKLTADKKKASTNNALLKAENGLSADEDPEKNAEAPQNSNNKHVTQMVDDEETIRNREAFIKRNLNVNKTATKNATKHRDGMDKKGKKLRKWDSGKNENSAVLDYSDMDAIKNGTETAKNSMVVGELKGDLPGIDEESDKNEESEQNFPTNKSNNGGSSWFSAFKSLTGGKILTRMEIDPVLDVMRETLMTRNVAFDPATRICDSIAQKLEGRSISTFSRITTIVRESMEETLTQLLTPTRRVNILRDILEAKSKDQPYTIVFCGVNGVGKSTNLAKITFWLNENGHKVLIAAADTFRAGAVEQLRTHCHHLNTLHPDKVQLFEQGYGKDSSSIASSAIRMAIEKKFDVVLVDTAGRMQDNEPLMRALGKLIYSNKPDLVLFVGEALVGNEAVDQLVKFNQALSDNSPVNGQVRLIDGIVLTKFDTIDDKVGAAISMTYITGQPILFVGTGQTYQDLRSLNANAVIKSLLK